MNLAALKELMVLQLVRDHPAHGYALSEALEDGFGWTLGLTRPTVYTILKRLEKRGWLKFKGAREGRYPEKQVYSLTARGRAEYSELVHWTALAGGASIQSFPALILHLDELAEEERLEALEVLREVREELAERVSSFPPHPGAIGVALAVMERQLDSELSAIDELIAQAR